MGGTLIIAFYYSQGVSWPALAVAAVFLAMLFGIKALGIIGTTIYILLGLAFVLAFMSSGVHPTVAGVILGLMVPASSCFSGEDFEKNVRELLERLKTLGERQTRIDDLDLETQRDVLIGQIDELATGTESSIR
jgi:NhaA family Na+:H+ antiporter